MRIVAARETETRVTIDGDEGSLEPENRRRESSGRLRAQVQALAAALALAHEGGGYDAVQLRDAVAAVARAARHDHVPPERVLVLLKRLTRAPALGHLSEWWRGILTDRFVRWGIEAYYGPPCDEQPDADP